MFNKQIKIVSIFSISLLLLGTASVFAEWPDAPNGGSVGGWLGDVFNLDESMSEKLVIKSNKVGVGIIDPLSKVHVKENWGYEGNPMVHLQNTNDGDVLYVKNTATSTQSDKYIADFQNGEGSVMAVKGDGNVGIGTTTPSVKLQVEGQVRAQGFFHASRSGKTYNSTPRQCIEVCATQNGRMATIAEMYAHASGKKNVCAHMWAIDEQNVGKVARGFIMYNNRTTSGCGTRNTGNIPRIEHLYRNQNWSSSTKLDCACYGIR